MRTATMPMTLTHARHLAARQVGYGRFRVSSTESWVNCPQANCSERISAHYAPHLESLSPHDIDDALRAAVVAHLREECKA